MSRSTFPVLCLACVWLASRAVAAVEYQSSATIDQSNSILNDVLIVSDGPSPPTIITLVDEGEIGSEDSTASPSVTLNGQSELHLLGGKVENRAVGVIALDSSRVIVRGGEI